jgi:hypothetical protein
MNGSLFPAESPHLLETFQHLIAHCFSQPGRHLPSQIEPHSINFQPFKKYAQDCNEKHEKCRSMVGWASRLRLIDVVTRQIVNAEAGWEYVAFSYVWGKDPLSQEELDSFPSVVEDAILATKELGCRYLWVDRHVRFHRPFLTACFSSLPEC